MLVTQLCPILCNPMDYSPPGSSVHGILQARYWSGLPCPTPVDLLDQGLNLGLLHCRWILSHLSHRRNPIHGFPPLNSLPSLPQPRILNIMTRKLMKREITYGFWKYFHHIFLIFQITLCINVVLFIWKKVNRPEFCLTEKGGSLGTLWTVHAWGSFCLLSTLTDAVTSLGLMPSSPSKTPNPKIYREQQGKHQMLTVCLSFFLGDGIMIFHFCKWYSSFLVFSVLTEFFLVNEQAVVCTKKKEFTVFE